MRIAEQTTTNSRANHLEMAVDLPRRRWLWEFLASYHRAILSLVPLSILVFCYVGICIHTQTVWPWNRVVHEDGIRTLLQTVFYFEHGVRELPVDVVLAIAIAGSIQFFFGYSRDVRNNQASLRWMLTVVAFATLATMLVGTVWTSGFRTLLENLEQLPTRVGEPLVWGAHWRYHLLERMSTILLSLGGVGICWLLRKRPIGTHRGSGLFLFALVTFVSLTLFYRPTLEPFHDPRFLGHQAREWVTHVSVSLPLALATCLALTKRLRNVSQNTSSHVGLISCSVIFSILLGAYVVLGAWLTKSMAQAQSHDFSSVVLAHFFEHTFTYLFVPSMAASIYLWSAHMQSE